MGSVLTRKRSNGKWEFRYEIAAINGKRKYYSKSGFNTKAEAIKAGNASLTLYNNSGSIYEPSNMSVSDYFDYWLATFCKYNLADSTYRTRETIIRLYIKPNLGKFFMKNITTSQLQEYVNLLASNKYLKRSYTSGIVKILKQGFKYAATHGDIRVNPASDVELPREGVKFDAVGDEEDSLNDIIILSKEEVNRILGTFRKSPHQYYAMLIAYHTGLRVGEAYGLTWSDIDFTNKTLSVKRTVKKFDYESKKGSPHRGIRGQAKTNWYLGAVKTPSSYRTITIGDQLLTELKEYREWQSRNREYYGQYYTKCYLKETYTLNGKKVQQIVQTTDDLDLPLADLICVKANGEFHGTDSMKYPSAKIRKTLGINFCFHAFRHTHASVLIEQGLPIKVVSERLGHANTNITWDFYVKVTSGLETKAVNAFESYLKDT